MDMKELYYKFEQYLMTEKRVAKNTVQAYQSDLLQAISFFEQKNCTSFQDLSPEKVSEYLQYLRVTLQLSARSSSRKLSALKSLSKYNQKFYRQPDFTFNVSFPKLEKNLPKFLTEFQIEEIFTAAQKDTSHTGMRNNVMITLMYICGVRVSELIELTRSNINFNDALLTVQGKGDKERIIPLPGGAIKLLENYLQNHQPYLFKNMKIDSDYVFPTLYAGVVKAMTRQAFWGILKDVVAQTTLSKKISPHILRHSIATHLLKKGANLRLLQMALGHERLETVQVYTHVEVSHLRKLYDEKHLRS